MNHCAGKGQQQFNSGLIFFSQSNSFLAISATANSEDPTQFCSQAHIPAGWRFEIPVFTSLYVKVKDTLRLTASQ
jgi:hypothetical protein